MSFFVPDACRQMCVSFLHLVLKMSFTIALGFVFISRRDFSEVSENSLQKNILQTIGQLMQLS